MMNIRRGLLVLAVMSVATLGCEKEVTKSGGDGGEKSTGEQRDSGVADTADTAGQAMGGSDLKGGVGDRCAGNEDCREGTLCVEGVCAPGGVCGASEFQISRVKPNLMIILDRSCSMSGSRWPTAVAAVTTLMESYGEGIRFGLDLFPDNLGEGTSDWARSCAMDPSGAVTVPLSPESVPAISNILAASLQDGDPNKPGEGSCQTPTYNAIAQAALDPALDSPDRPSYFMLITDGEATCQNASVGGDIAMINALVSDLANNRHIPTFVVGFGGDVSKADMRSHAQAGGTATDDGVGYYQADSPDALLAAISQITNTLVSCDYHLGQETPPDEDIYVFFNDVDRIPQDTDHQNGWDYDQISNSVKFYGAACDTIQEGGADLDIDVVFGCPAPIID